LHHGEVLTIAVPCPESTGKTSLATAPRKSPGTLMFSRDRADTRWHGTSRSHGHVSDVKPQFRDGKARATFRKLQHHHGGALGGDAAHLAAHSRVVPGVDPALEQVPRNALQVHGILQ